MAVPIHIAIIMDGNGRWAKERNLPRAMGHAAGARTVTLITEACARRGIKALTLYSFSTENWKRPKHEVDMLMALFSERLKEEFNKLEENNIRFNVIGRISELVPRLAHEIENAIELTSGNTGMIFTLAINYGGRQEILDAARALSREVADGRAEADTLTEEDLNRHLYTHDLPELDFLIRTSGETRISNFLLWQAAYAELYFTDTFWPDFKVKDLEKALEEYSKRERRFGE